MAAGYKGFQKGQSGNPSGRKKVDRTIDELAKKEAPEAFKRIIEIATGCDDARLRLQANTYIIDRAYGKPAQAMQVTGEDGGSITVEIVQHDVKGDG